MQLEYSTLTKSLILDYRRCIMHDAESMTRPNASLSSGEENRSLSISRWDFKCLVFICQPRINCATRYIRSLNRRVASFRARVPRLHHDASRTEEKERERESFSSKILQFSWNLRLVDKNVLSRQYEASPKCSDIETSCLWKIISSGSKFWKVLPKSLWSNSLI